MTEYQNIALRFPCYFATETAQPKYAHQIGQASSLVLTINSGYE